MTTTEIPADLRRQSAPSKDRTGRRVPAHTMELLTVVSILAGYGRHLAETLEQRAVARGFATIARFFCSVDTNSILAHLRRGLMRAFALQRLLMRRIDRGYDMPCQDPRKSSRRKPAAEDGADNEPIEALGPAAALMQAEDAAAREAAREAAARLAGERLARRIGRNEPLTLDNLPSMSDIDAEVRRSPVGRTIVAICLDLGVVPLLCERLFWNRVMEAIHWHRGSIDVLMQEKLRREIRFAAEDWKHPGLERPAEIRDDARRVLGFLIGGDPVNPCAEVVAPEAAVVAAAVVAAATGPPD
jgi:hypothetical protein